MFPISLMTTSTLARLNQLEPLSEFDLRRFRMNVIVDAPQDGFVENLWLGRALAVGDDVYAVVASPSRCARATASR